MPLLALTKFTPMIAERHSKYKKASPPDRGEQPLIGMKEEAFRIVSRSHKDSSGRGRKGYKFWKLTFVKHIYKQFSVEANGAHNLPGCGARRSRAEYPGQRSCACYVCFDSLSYRDKGKRNTTQHSHDGKIAAPLRRMQRIEHVKEHCAAIQGG